MCFYRIIATHGSLRETRNCVGLNNKLAHGNNKLARSCQVFLSVIVGKKFVQEFNVPEWG
jgi:hypothetical protein